MRIRVDYFVGDDTNLDYLELAGKIRKFLRSGADYQNGEITISTSMPPDENIYIEFYLRDCEHMAETKRVIKKLTECLIAECT